MDTVILVSSASLPGIANVVEIIQEATDREVVTLSLLDILPVEDWLHVTVRAHSGAVKHFEDWIYAIAPSFPVSEVFWDDIRRIMGESLKSKSGEDESTIVLVTAPWHRECDRLYEDLGLKVRACVSVVETPAVLGWVPGCAGDITTPTYSVTAESLEHRREDMISFFRNRLLIEGA